MLEQLRYDVRHVVRGLLRDRSFTAIALLSVGLGVGANSAIFSLVDQALFRHLPVREPERLVLLSWNGAFIGTGWGSGNLLSHPMFRDLKAENQVFDGLIARHPTRVYLSVEGTPTPVNAEIVSGCYFGVLGVRPALGRLLDESDDVQPGAHPVVVVSYDYWKNRLGGREDVVGRKVLVNGFPMTVIGVAAAGFRGVDWGEVPSLWIPTMMKKQATPEFDWLDDRRGRWLHVFGRLKPGVSGEQAQARLQPWFKAMLEADTRREGWPRVTEEQRRRFLASSLDVLPAAYGRSDLRQRLERPLLVLLAATVLVLLIGAGLFVRTLSNLRAQGPGFDTTNLLSLHVDPARIAYSQPRGERLLLDLLAALRTLPEVEHAASSTATLVGGGSWNMSITIQSDRRFVTDRAAHINAISPGFFATLRAPLLAGRDFDERDAPSGPEQDFRHAIVNESFARRYFGDRSPIGARLGFGNRPDTKVEMEIVGIVTTFSYRGLRETDDQVFVPFLESTIRGSNYYVRSRAGSKAAFASIRAAARALDPALPVDELRTLDDQLDRALANERILAILATAFAALAVMLAVVGLYGVTSFVVTRRTREIGIRMALGATREAALWLVIRDTGVLVIGGIVIALPAVWGLGRLIESQHFGVGALDGATVAACAALVALAASAVPARRASSLNPVEALRCE